MNDREKILTMLKEEFNRWEELLAGLSEEQITTLHLPNGWAIKDLMAHLMAWQQISIARLEAAQLDKEPVFPEWLAGSDPESEEERDQFNARIYETYRDQPWSRVHQSWRDGFLRFLKMADGIPEDDHLDAEKYPWLKGHALIAVLQGSYEHHHVDHLEPLLAWIRRQRSDEGHFSPT
jgi:hypothetical protein